MVDVLILPRPNPTNPRADTDTEDVSDEILIDSAISEVSVTLEVQSLKDVQGPELPEEQSKTESLGYKTRAKTYG